MSHTHNIQMLEVVAQALGQDLRQEVAFVGGCTTALLLTDEFSREEVRYTDDVDLVIHLTGYAQWQKLVEQLRQKGFKQSPQDEVICRMRLGELKVDFMPEDADTANLLGCNNRWFKDGLANAQWHELPSGCPIRLFTPPYFLGSKLEAYAGRGAQNPLGSQDLEDILNLVNGREELLQEVDAAAPELRAYLAEKLTALLGNNDFGYLVQDAARGDNEREQIIWQRLRHIVQVAA
jgi:predicted nucleotidyltransferase